jgi:hypothetical protein
MESSGACGAGTLARLSAKEAKKGLGAVIGTIGGVLSGAWAFWLPMGIGLGIALGGLMGRGTSAQSGPPASGAARK